MAATRLDRVGDGSTTVYDVAFDLGYIRKSYVFVYLEGNEVSNQLAYTWVNDTQVELLAPLAVGVKFSIRRIVPRNQPVNDYESGAILREDNLDDSFVQSLMILEEIEDGYLAGEGSLFIDSDIDMKGNRVINSVPAVNSADLVTLGQMTEVIAQNTLTGSANGSTPFHSVASLEGFSRALVERTAITDVSQPDTELDSKRLDALERLLADTPENVVSSGIPLDGTVRSSEVNAAIVEHQSIYLPTGTLKASGIVPVNGTHITGDGQSKSIITPAAANTTVMQFNNGQADTLVKDVWFEGLGYPSATTENGIVYDGTQNCRRNSIENSRFNGFSGAALRFSAGWGNRLKQVNINSCLIGLDFKVSPLLAGWSGSGFLSESSYIATCDTGIRMEAIWNYTSINQVIEDCNLPVNQTQSATPAVWINSWYESNSQSPRFTQSNIIIGGRNAGGEAPLTHFYGNMSLPAAPYDYECITDITYGISIFRDVTAQVFKADGQGVKFFKPAPELGWDVLAVAGQTSKKLSVARGAAGIGGGITSETWGNDAGQWVDATKLVARRHFNSYDVDSMQELGVKVQGQGASSSGGIGFTRVVISTGRYVSGGGGATNSGIRWIWDEDGNYKPATDGLHTIGDSAARVKDLYIVNAPIVGSDYRIKQEPREIPQALLDFALATPMYEYELIGRVRTHYGIVITKQFLIDLAKVVSLDNCGAFCQSVFTDATGKPITEYVGGLTTEVVPKFTNLGYSVQIPLNCKVIIGDNIYRVDEGKCNSPDVRILEGVMFATKLLNDSKAEQLKEFEEARKSKLEAPDLIRQFIEKQTAILMDAESDIKAVMRADTARENAMGLIAAAEAERTIAAALQFQYKPKEPLVRVTSGDVLIGDLWQVRYDEWQNILLEALRRKVVNTTA